MADGMGEREPEPAKQVKTYKSKQEGENEREKEADGIDGRVKAVPRQRDGLWDEQKKKPGSGCLAVPSWIRSSRLCIGTATGSRLGLGRHLCPYLYLHPLPVYGRR